MSKFEGNTADPKTLAKQLTKLRDRFPYLAVGFDWRPRDADAKTN